MYLWPWPGLGPESLAGTGIRAWSFLDLWPWPPGLGPECFIVSSASNLSVNVFDGTPTTTSLPQTIFMKLLNVSSIRITPPCRRTNLSSPPSIFWWLCICVRTYIYSFSWEISLSLILKNFTELYVFAWRLASTLQH